jgi:hypothetical protein
MDRGLGPFRCRTDPREDEVGSDAASKRPAEKIRQAGRCRKCSGGKCHGGADSHPGGRGHGRRHGNAGVDRHDCADCPAQCDHCAYGFAYSQGAAIAVNHSKGDSATGGVSFADAGCRAHGNDANTCSVSLSKRRGFACHQTLSTRVVESVTFRRASHRSGCRREGG